MNRAAEFALDHPVLTGVAALAFWWWWRRGGWNLNGSRVDGAPVGGQLPGLTGGDYPTMSGKGKGCPSYSRDANGMLIINICGGAEY